MPAGWRDGDERTAGCGAVTLRRPQRVDAVIVSARSAVVCATAESHDGVRSRCADTVAGVAVIDLHVEEVVGLTFNPSCVREVALLVEVPEG